MGTGELVTLLSNGGALVVICALFILGWIVPRNALDNMRQERDTWRKAAETQQEIATAVLSAGAAERDVLRALQHIAVSPGKGLPP